MSLTEASLHVERVCRLVSDFGLHESQDIFEEETRIKDLSLLLEASSQLRNKELFGGLGSNLAREGSRVDARAYHVTE